MIAEAAGMIINCYSHNGKLLICGNGGSCSDAEHMVAELMKSFEIKRNLEPGFKNHLREISGSRGDYLAENLEHGLAAIALTSHSSLITAISNDMDPALIYAQQILAYASENDILIGISTSGNSQNIIDACIAARAMNIKIIGITGSTGGKMKAHCDLVISVPSSDTAFIQELHRPIIHTLCRIVENHFYGFL